jgi:hypothetical protein
MRALHYIEALDSSPLGSLGPLVASLTGGTMLLGFSERFATCPLADRALYIARQFVRTIRTTRIITGTSISTPTTVASAAQE